VEPGPAVCPDGFTVSDADFNAGFGACDTYAQGEVNELWCEGDGADIACPSECGTCPACDDGAMDDGNWVHPVWGSTCKWYTEGGQYGPDLCDEDGATEPCPVTCGGCAAPGPVCGDAVCEEGETCDSCEADCGVCETCGDDLCNADEDCASCPGDCGGCVAKAEPGDVIITEVMVNPASVSDADGEYIELYNMTAIDLDLSGLLIDDNTSSEELGVNGPLIIAPDGFLVLGSSSDVGGYTPDWVWANIALANSDDTIGLQRVEADGSTTVIDLVSYDAAWPYGVGASMMLSDDQYDSISNDDAGVWCQSSTSFGLGDLGSPGEWNGTCNGDGGDGGDDSNCCVFQGDGTGCDQGTVCRDAVCTLDPVCCGAWDSWCSECASGQPGWAGLDCSSITPDQCSCQDTDIQPVE
jgi:hypothetical protein